MKRILINATQQEEIRTAIVDGQKLIDFDIEIDSKRRKKGNIYKGVITRVEPSLNAVFVEYGADRHGFLPFKEISKSYFKKGSPNEKPNHIKEGQQVIVQVRREERGTKGAALTTFISLAGHRLILMPDKPSSSGISRRIDGQEREEMQDILSQLNIEDNESVIIRTAGIGQSAEDLQWNLDNLRTFWQEIITAAKSKPAPFLIYKEHDVVMRTLRDYLSDEIGEVLIDNKDSIEPIEEFVESMMPDQLDKLHLYENDIPLFSYYQVESEIETAYEREIRLQSGAVIVFDHTEALLAIDINSGRATRGSDIEETALETNLEACEEIARQLRLRDAGGLIVIDFIDMMSYANQKTVENELKAKLRNDRARVQVGQISRFGLMELSRQRLRSSLGDVSYIPCPRCSGHGSIRTLESSAMAALRMMEEESAKQQTGLIVAHLPVNVTSFLLNEKRNSITHLEKLYEVEITIVPDIQMETPHFKINRYRKDDETAHNKASHEWIEIREQSDKTDKLRHSQKIQTDEETPAIKSYTATAGGVAKRGSFLKRLFGFLPFATESSQSKTQQDDQSRSSKPRGQRSRQRSQRRSRFHSSSNAQERRTGQRDFSQRQRGQTYEGNGRQWNKNDNQQGSSRRRAKAEQSSENRRHSRNGNTRHSSAGNRRSPRRQRREAADKENTSSHGSRAQPPFTDNRRSSRRRGRGQQDAKPFEKTEPAYGNQQLPQNEADAADFPDDNIGNRIDPLEQIDTRSDRPVAEQTDDGILQSWQHTSPGIADEDIAESPYADQNAAADEQRTQTAEKTAVENTDQQETPLSEHFPMPSDITQVETKAVEAETGVAEIETAETEAAEAKAVEIDATETDIETETVEAKTVQTEAVELEVVETKTETKTQVSLFNTLSGKQEDFVPLNQERITMYVCGPTVYDHIHIGNARPIVVFDTLYRLFREIHGNVVYVRNITDIDDKIINAAKQNNETVEALTKRQIEQFHHDIAGMNVLPPSVEPRATEHLPQMIELIELLLQKGYAYEAEKHVLFEVGKMPAYGQLSKRNPEEMIAGARVEVAPYKKAPADFVLWKPSSEEQPGWQSPWGRGRPGWHLECSVMAKIHLGNVIDIHGGGQDLIFPHHENEIAQNCCAYDEPLFAKYWLHNGYITVNNEKMSKSLGNFFTLHDVLKQWHGETIRYALLSTHYHKPLDWSESILHQAKQNLDKLYRRLLEAGQRPSLEDTATDQEVIASLSNNINTPSALARLHQLAETNQHQKLIASARLLGLLNEEPEVWFHHTPKASGQTPSDTEIEKLIQERETARLNKDFATADKIRDDLIATGILLEDRDGETRWRQI